MNKKNMFLVLFGLVAILIFASSAMAIDLQVGYVKLNGDIIDQADGHAVNYEVRRGEDLDIRVKLTALKDVKDAVVRADIIGYEYSNYEHDSVSDESRTFDLDANDTVFKELHLKVPVKLDKDYIKLRIYVADRDSTSFEETYELHIKGVSRSDAVIVKDFTFMPSNTVRAGGALTALVRVKNIGDYDLDDVKVTISVPELNVVSTETLDDLKADETETLEEFLLRIPSSAESKAYDVNIKVDFDEYESTVETTQIIVTGAPASNEETPASSSLVNVPDNMIMTESGVAFPITIVNNGNTDAMYALSVNGLDWADYSFDPAADVIVPAKSTQTVYLHINAKDALTQGTKYFELQVLSDNKVSKAALSVTVNTPAQSSNFKNTLEVVLIVLVIILIIIGLIIGFSKLKDNKGDEEDDDHGYY